MTATVRIVVTGRVQGVGFRAATCRQAAQSGVSGWVRNRRDGSVEILAYGSLESVASLQQWARRGPPAARVQSMRADRINSDQEPPEPAIVSGRFVELPTV